jgi:hypothetical protein
MSPLCEQSTIFLQSELTEDFNSELFWVDGTIDYDLNEDMCRLFEGITTTLDGPPILLPSFE